MTAHDDEPVVVCMPFAVACELEGYLTSLVNVHAENATDEDFPLEFAIYAERMGKALAAVREGLRPLMLPEDAPANVIPLRPRGAR